MITSRPLTALMALTIAAAVSAHASAQTPCNLPESVITARSISSGDQSAIRACVDANSAALGSGDYAAVRQARQALLTPLRAGNASVPFRDAYSEALRTVLTPLIAHQSEDVAINALRIAGELGSVAGARLCVQGLADQRPGVRMSAAFGLSRTFSVLQTTPTMGFQQVSTILTGGASVASALKKEQDPLVLDGIAMIYEAAVQVPSTTVEGARNAALLDAARGFGERVREKKLGPAANTAMLRVSRAVLDALTRQQGEPKPPDATLVELGGFGGDLLVHALRRVAAGNELEARERQELAVLVGQAENLIAICGDLLGAPAPRLNLQRLMDGGDDRRFRTDVFNIVGAQGYLVLRPFNLPKERFAP